MFHDMFMTMNYLHDMFTICVFMGPDMFRFHDMLCFAICFTICLFISPDLDGHRAPKMKYSTL